MTRPLARPPRPAEPGTPAGWGEPTTASSSGAFAHVAAVPSATIELRHGAETIDRIPWLDLERACVLDSAEGAPGAGAGRNWVRSRIVDDATGAPLSCRIAFLSPAGVPYPPNGHPGQLDAGRPSWHVDVGGDVRLGGRTFAYVDGACEGWLPRGDVIVEAARGFEYEPLRQRVTIADGQTDLELRLRRISDVRRDGWFSGDTHVHFLSTQGAHLEARGEDLDVVNLLLSQWGGLFTNAEDFTGRPDTAPGGTIVYAAQENRQHFLGHLGLLGLSAPVAPWCSDGPDEAQLGGSLESTLADWADRTHDQGGAVILSHFPLPGGEPPALIATGRADAVEMIAFDLAAHDEYYRYLNAGYRLPLVGGTDKMDSWVPVGLYRTYVQVPSDEDFTYDAWLRGLVAGRTYLSGGPILRVRVDGHEIGDTITLPRGGGKLTVEASADSIFGLSSLQVVLGGQVVACADGPGVSRLELREEISVAGSNWLAVRAGGPDYGRPRIHHTDSWLYGANAHSSPIYVSCHDDGLHRSPAMTAYMRTLVEGGLHHVRTQGLGYPAGTVHHHREPDHAAYLERPFREALAALDGSDRPSVATSRRESR